MSLKIHFAVVFVTQKVRATLLKGFHHVWKDLDGRSNLMSVYCEFCTDGFYLFVSVTVSSKLKTTDFVVGGGKLVMKMNLLPAHEHVIYWIQQITGSKMAQSDLRIEIEQPQVFFYFPNDNHVYICVFPCSSSVICTCFPSGLHVSHRWRHKR